ncbi:hypothetical protein MLD63_12140 [Paracoccus sp. TK19116]|uniref:Uncharacterized protein n=1 Tax=Paracoccus albicereus TaxID=2922394 RepID=A0ABT1MS96_9RHOB|nr:hypothetical protein [Paracoccus albicereus]MCQ0971172.1 hypothetical protein [Paracoccus albicereus]
MIGVVLWSNEERQKAVIWCEDHQALAYLDGTDDLTEGTVWPTIGDILELESETIGNLRRARRVSRLEDCTCPQIPAILRGECSAPHLRLVSSRSAVRRDQAEADIPERISATR